MSLFQLMHLEHLQISFTLVAFTSVPFCSSPCRSWMCLQIISQVSPPTGITQFNFFSFSANPVFPILLFPSPHHKWPQSPLNLKCLIVHTPGTFPKAATYPFLFKIYNFIFIPSAKSFTWVCFCLTYRELFWPTQYRHNCIMNPHRWICCCYTNHLSASSF